MRIQTSSSTRKNSKKAGFLAAVFLVGFGLVMMLVTEDMIAEARESETWPGAPGTVAESSISSHVKTDDGKKQTMYSAFVQAEYEVDGVRYSTTQVNMAGSSSTSVRSMARKTADRYPEGAAVTVFYDPDHPGNGVLEPGMPWILRILNILPYVLFFFAALALIRAILRLAGMATALGFLIAKKDKPATAAPPPQPPRPASPPPASPADPTTAAPESPEEQPAKPVPPPADEKDDGFSI